MKIIDKISELMRMGIPSKNGYFIKSRGTFGDKVTLGIAKSDEEWLLLENTEIQKIPLEDRTSTK